MRRDELKRKICGYMVSGKISAVGCSSMRASTMGGEYYCGNLLWQSCRTFYPSVDYPGLFGKVYSFLIPNSELRPDLATICIEHYYTDDELKTEIEFKGVKRRLSLSGEFIKRNGQTKDHQYSDVPAALEFVKEEVWKVLERIVDRLYELIAACDEQNK